MFEVKFADIGEGIHEGVIYTIEVEVGQEIEDGDNLFLVETDKVTAEIPSPVSGTIESVRFKAGDTINVGDVIMTIDDGEVSEAVEHEIVTEQGSTSVVGDLEISSELIAASDEVAEKKVLHDRKAKVLATPVARKMAKDLGLDISSIVGTGPAGRVMKADIYAAQPQKQEVVQKKAAHKMEAARVVAEETVKRLPMTTIRKVIAEKMTKSKFTIPHTAVMDEVDVSKLVDYRNEVKHLASEKNVKLTYLPFIIKALVVALKAHEIMNASLDEVSEEILIKKDIHIGIAVDTPFGLMVPVIRHADKKSLLELALAIDDLSARAQNKTLTLHEISGSTFTITNYGAFGSSFGVPVINYPEAAILGIGLIAKKPMVRNDEIVIGDLLPLSLSFDHRIIDGADAGRFLNTLKQLLKDPQLLLLS